MVELFAGGTPHVEMMRESQEAFHSGKGKRYTREDFDKWLGDFDSVTDIPTYIMDDLVLAYPEAKFILTLRENDAWVRSVKNTFLPWGKAEEKFPLTFLKYFDPFLWAMAKRRRSINKIFWGGVDLNDEPAALEAARQYYIKHNERALKIIPPKNLLVVNLEEGLGWEEICPFLGHSIPDVPYPRTNNPRMFKAITTKILRDATWRASLRLATMTAPIIGALVWWYWKS